MNVRIICGLVACLAAGALGTEGHSGRAPSGAERTHIRRPVASKRAPAVLTPGAEAADQQAYLEMQKAIDLLNPSTPGERKRSSGFQPLFPPERRSN